MLHDCLTATLGIESGVWIFIHRLNWKKAADPSQRPCTYSSSFLLTSFPRLIRYHLDPASAHTYSAQALDLYRYFKFSTITIRIALKF